MFLCYAQYIFPNRNGPKMLDVVGEVRIVLKVLLFSAFCLWKQINYFVDPNKRKEDMKQR